ncbi:MAG TPA: glycosyltransferase [Solirubrobacteraceae bacterium]|nr:glycosyltransferase [Solirubrobacteraceae bacterium]
MSGAPRRVLFDALAARFGGGAHAAAQIALHLARTPAVAAVTVVARRDSIVAERLAGAEGVSVVQLPAAAALELPRRVAWEAFRLRALARRERSDVLLTMTALPARVRDARLVCVFANPVMYETDTAANRLRRRATRRTVRDASYLAAPSSMMAGLVSDYLGRPCAVLPLGVDHQAFTPADPPGEEVLCVADFYAHKRHDVLLDAWASLPAPRPRLRLIGDPAVDPGTFARVRERVALLGEGAGEVSIEHRLPMARLVEAYRAARVFVMPSERESFCMPLAEAMACGVPAVARSIESLRETGGEGALYVRDADPAVWSAEIARVLGDGGVHTRLRAAAIAAASRFSWERCAAQLSEQL